MKKEKGSGGREGEGEERERERGKRGRGRGRGGREGEGEERERRRKGEGRGEKVGERNKTLVLFRVVIFNIIHYSMYRIPLEFDFHSVNVSNQFFVTTDQSGCNESQFYNLAVSYRLYH